jgi:dihydrofolate reductase
LQNEKNKTTEEIGTHMDIIIIAAIAEDRTIGDNGDIPWHHSEDLQRFRKLTTGHPVILGRKTYQSIYDRIDGPLPERVNIVLTSNPDQLPNAATDHTNLQSYNSDTIHTETLAVTSKDKALTAAKELNKPPVYIAGGKQVYSQFLDTATKLEITKVHSSPAGDTKFPKWNKKPWLLTNTEPHTEYTFNTYTHKDRRI